MSQETIAREAARWWLDAHDGDRDENAFEQWCRADPRHAAQYLHLQELWQAGAATPAPPIAIISWGAACRITPMFPPDMM